MKLHVMLKDYLTNMENVIKNGSNKYSYNELNCKNCGTKTYIVAEASINKYENVYCPKCGAKEIK